MQQPNIQRKNRRREEEEKRTGPRRRKKKRCLGDQTLRCMQLGFPERRICTKQTKPNKNKPNNKKEVVGVDLLLPTRKPKPTFEARRNPILLHYVM